MRKVIFIALSLLSVVGYGQGIKISALPQAGSLTGSELTPVVQNGITKKTSVQSIANLGGGGGSQNLQAVTTVGNTTSNNVQLLDSGNLIIGAYGGVLLDNSTSLKEGTFDNGTGGSKGVSLNCAVGYELNWQGGHLSSSYNNGATFYPIIIDTALQVNGLGGSGSVIVTADNTGLLGKASLNNLAWGLSGNSGTDPATNFIGTTDGKPLYIKSDSISTISYKGSGAVIGVGNTSSFGGSDSSVFLRGNIAAISAIAETNISGPILSITVDTTQIYNALVLDNGTQGVGKVLTSDAYGLATWADGSASNLWSINGNSGTDPATNYLGTTDTADLIIKCNSDSNRINLFRKGSGYGQSHYSDTYNWFDKEGNSNNFSYDSRISLLQLQNGQLQLIGNAFIYQDGTEGAGKVLTSDAGGNASWQTLALTDTATLNFGSISPNGHEVLTMTVTGAALSDVVSLGIPNASIDAHASFVAWVSSANTVSVKCFNFDGSSFNPAAGLFTVKVFK